MYIVNLFVSLPLMIAGSFTLHALIITSSADKLETKPTAQTNTSVLATMFTLFYILLLYGIKNLICCLFLKKANAI